MRDAVRNDPCLARARAGKDQKRPIGLKNGFLLFGIETCEQIQVFILPSSSDVRLQPDLFDGNAHCQIARLIHVTAATYGNVVREKLQRDRHDNGRQQRRRCRHRKHHVARVEHGRHL